MPNADGRAGMAALVVDDPDGFDLPGLRAFLAQRLPVYARPLFIRFRPGLDVTGTFKQKKSDLVAEGFDPTRTTDPIFFDDRRAGAYVPVRPDFAARLVAGEFAV